MGSKYAVNTDHLFLRLDSRHLGVYNSWDTYQTARLAPVLLKEISKKNNDYYWNVVHPLQRAVIDMQRRGMLLDRDALNTYRRKVRSELKECDELILQADSTGRLSEPTGKSPNSIGSPKKLASFLFGVLGLKATKRTETGMDSTDQEALYGLLRKLRKKDGHTRPVLLALFHRSRLKTIYQRYLSIETGVDGRARAKVKMYGTKTFRYSYSEPALQQFPPEARHVFKAGIGHRFLSVDYSQLEARLLALLSKDRASLKVFDSGGDVHTENSKDLGLEATKESRGFAKTFLYGLSYGGQAETMKTKLFCPCDRCIDQMPPTLELTRPKIKEAEIRWLKKHPAIKKWHTKLLSGVYRTRCYKSPLGVTRYFSAPYGLDLEREVKNAPMQMGAAVLMNRAQVKLHEAGLPVILQMHDEFVLEVPKGDVQSIAAQVQSIMETPVAELDGVVFPTKVGVGETWGSLK